MIGDYLGKDYNVLIRAAIVTAQTQDHLKAVQFAIRFGLVFNNKTCIAWNEI